jgi:hypothetical protein
LKELEKIFNLIAFMINIAIRFLFVFGLLAYSNSPGISAETTEAEKGAAKYELAAGGLMIEEQSLTSVGHADRALVLWMLKPEKHPTDYAPDEPYTCPDYTRGSYYSGPVRVSLIDTKTGKIINTVEVKTEGDDGSDSFDIPYAIRKGHYYKVEGNPKEGVEVKPRLLWLKDYNGDGKALEFALFDAEACMGLDTTLIGYSERQDKVIQYPIRLKEGSDKSSVHESHWCDYLFSKEPKPAGHWKYEIDYRGRGGALEKYEIRYDPKSEQFEGTHTATDAQ